MMNIQQRELYHSWLGDKWKKHKYVDRIKLPNGKWRYIYPEDLKKNVKIAGEKAKNGIDKAVDVAEYALTGVVGKKVINKSAKYNEFKRSVKEKIYDKQHPRSMYLNNKNEWKYLDTDKNPYRKNKQNKRSGKPAVMTKADISRREREEKRFNNQNGKDFFKTEERVSGKKKYKYVGRIRLSNGEYRYFYNQQELENYYLNHGSEVEVTLTDWYGIKDSYTDRRREQLEVNEGYDLDGGTEYRHNCYSCSMAYDLRRRGFDVEAIPSPKGIADYEIRSCYKMDDDDYHLFNCIKPSIVERLKGVKQEDKDRENLNKVVNEFTDYAHSQGDGSRGQLLVSWKNGGGHSMVWEVAEGGKVQIVDCQTRKVYEGSDVEALFSRTLYNTDKGIEWFRTDDKELTNDILDCVRKNQ